MGATLYAGLVTRLHGPTADIAAFRKRGSLRPPSSSRQTIPASRTFYGDATGRSSAISVRPGGGSRKTRPRKSPVTPRYTGRAPQLLARVQGALHSPRGTFAHGRSACWS